MGAAVELQKGRPRGFPEDVGELLYSHVAGAEMVVLDEHNQLYRTASGKRPPPDDAVGEDLVAVQAPFLDFFQFEISGHVRAPPLRAAYLAALACLHEQQRGLFTGSAQSDTLRYQKSGIPEQAKFSAPCTTDELLVMSGHSQLVKVRYCELLLSPPCMIEALLPLGSSKTRQITSQVLCSH